MQGKTKLFELAKQLEGELYFDETLRRLYATDASAYREIPLAVAFPKNEADIKTLINFAHLQNTSLIPRTAGTSLAGQVVGSGIIVDVSKYFTKILEVNKEEGWVKVQPGVIRDDLNRHLKKFGLYFGPETSTANRAMIGGMVGNNSCGSNSVVYGSTRDHLLEVQTILSDGNEAHFMSVSAEEFERKCNGENTKSSLEHSIYASIKTMLSDVAIREEIDVNFPKKSITRRNTGYALDLLMDADCFGPSKQAFNFCKLLAGSEGTLAFITEIKLHVDPLPPSQKLLVCSHFNSIYDSLKANLIALKYQPQASELIDHFVLECTKGNREQSKNRFFIQGDPKAILVVDLSDHSIKSAQNRAQRMIQELKDEGLGYHYPILLGEDTTKIWSLRKAGLGLLSNIPGDAKPAPVIEDTAVDVYDLPEYIKEFNVILNQHQMSCVHYAHAGSGELHLRPILDLKTEKGQQDFRMIASEIAALVKKYKGSLSGEHGDGRLRGEFIKEMVGPLNYEQFKKVKNTWDPSGIFNPGKIVETPPMDSSLRFDKNQVTPEIKTVLDFSTTKGFVRAAEQCNGSGDCRKSPEAGGTMCPSYMATRNEKDTTRARANILREFFTKKDGIDPFKSNEVKEILDLCLSCKGCKSECPSNVDMAKLKAEFMHGYYQKKGIPFRARMIANFSRMSSVASIFPWFYNLIVDSKLLSTPVKIIMGMSLKRSIPKLHKYTLKQWYNRNKADNFGIKPIETKKGKVHFFCDEFTNYNDVLIGQKAIKLLARLGYEVIIPNHTESGRTFLSKAFLNRSKKIAKKNIEYLHPIVTKDAPLVGLEPSAILTFRDEYPDLLRGSLLEKAKELSENTFTIEEFLDREAENGMLQKAWFTTESKTIKLHGHCHQKATASIVPTKRILSFPEHYNVQNIPSGCCGMAGSFGYEKEHYDLSMQVGELVLFPAIRNSLADEILAAPGTSCRHQIKDGTQKDALHPVEILYNALK